MTLSEIKSEFKALKETVNQFLSNKTALTEEELTQAQEQWTTRLAGLEEELRNQEDLNQQLGHALALVKEREEQLAKEREEHEASLQSAMEKANELGARAAAKIAASQGIPKIPNQSTSDQASTAELWAQYNALSDPAERVRFYRKHEKALSPRSQV